MIRVEAGDGEDEQGRLGFEEKIHSGPRSAMKTTRLMSMHHRNLYFLYSLMHIYQSTCVD